MKGNKKKKKGKFWELARSEINEEGRLEAAAIPVINM